MRTSRSSCRLPSAAAAAAAGLLCLTLSGCAGDSEKSAEPSDRSASANSRTPSITPSITPSAMPSATASSAAGVTGETSSQPEDLFGGGGGNTEDDEQLSVERAPKLEDATEVLASATSVSGSRTVPFGPVTTRTLAWRVDCVGEGALTVFVEKFMMEPAVQQCSDTVSFAEESGAVPEPLRLGAVVVKAPSTVRWSLSVGR
ncbi:hypothetical protein ABZY19_39135 [Streptomyces sp. NPDC006475]|uniref:hypothetical protein n=1 Tax=Streptomyces sp. NPDC006475 TaxID=3155719 RepID=UPI0033AF26D2